MMFCFSLALNCLYLYSAPLDPYLVATCSSQFNQTRRRQLDISCYIKRERNKGSRKKALTGVRKDSATNRALALSCKGGRDMLVCVQYPKYSKAMHMTYEELHLGNLLVNLLLELNDKVDKLVLQHLFGVEVCYQEGNVIALYRIPSQHTFFPNLLSSRASLSSQSTHRNRFSPQNEE
jgi:hypothetical protein